MRESGKVNYWISGSENIYIIQNLKPATLDNIRISQTLMGKILIMRTHTDGNGTQLC